MNRIWHWITRRKAKIAIVAVLVLLLAVAALVQVSLDSSARERPGWDQSSPLDMGRSLLDVLGGIRQSLAAYFWTKADNVFHGYMGHGLGTDGPLYPYYWMITRLDQHFEMPFYYASWMLCRSGRVEEGIKLAQEGVKYNPESGLLQENLAEIYFYYRRDPEKARYHGLKALALAKNDDERFMYIPFQKVIDQVIAGTKKIPKVPDLTRMHIEPDSDEHGHQE